MHFQRSRFLPWISAACLGAALLAGAAWAGTAEGVRAYDRGQFALAAKELQPAAQAGDPEAQFHLGLMHDFGKGVQVTIPRQSRGHSGCEPLKAAVRGR